MPIFLKEDEGGKLGAKQFIVPKDIADYMKKLYNQYDGRKEYKNLPGYKRLHSIVNSEYNKQSDKKDRQNGSLPTVSFSDIKRMDFDFRHMPQNDKNIQYVMSGGDKMRDWVRNTLSSARTGVKEVGDVPEVPKLEKDTSLNIDASTNQANVGGIDVNIRMESFEDKIRKTVE